MEPEPPGKQRWWGKFDEGEEPDERFFNHGIRELGSGLLFVYRDETELGKDDELGFRLQEGFGLGLGWYDDEHGLADVDPDPPLASTLAAGLQPYTNTQISKINMNKKKKMKQWL